MYAELVFPAGTTVEKYNRDVTRIINASDGAGGANTSILEFADQGASTIVDTVASEWTLDPTFTLPTGATTSADMRYIVQQPHQNGSTKSVIIGNVNQHSSGFEAATNNEIGMTMGMVWNRDAADPANYMAYSALSAKNYNLTNSNYGRHSHTYNATEATTLVVWAQPRSIGLITTAAKSVGNVSEAAIMAIVENVDTYESKWRGVPYPMQAAFSDHYMPTLTMSANNNNTGENYGYYANTDTSALYPYAYSTIYKPRVLFQNTFWDRGNDRFMSMTYHDWAMKQSAGAPQSTSYSVNSATFGYWYMDESDSLGRDGFTIVDGNSAYDSYPKSAGTNLNAQWAGSSPSWWPVDGGFIIYGARTMMNNWQNYQPRDDNGNPAVVLTPVVYRVGDEARYQDYSSEAGFYFASTNFKDSEHMYYKFLTDGNGDTFLMFYSDYSDSWSQGGYAIKVS